jgi:hypothetical protein
MQDHCWRHAIDTCTVTGSVEHTPVGTCKLCGHGLPVIRGLKREPPRLGVKLRELLFIVAENLRS